MRRRLAYRGPYDWEGVAQFLGTRAIPGVERVDAVGYARTLALPEGPAVVQVRPIEGDTALELQVQGAAPTALLRVCATARRCFDLSADPARILRSLAPDPLLGPLVRRRPGLRIPGIWDPFECAVRAILGQQVSVAAGRTLAARLVARCGAAAPPGTHGLTHVFPTPEAVASAELAGLGLTTARGAALQALARAVASGSLDFTAAADDVTAALAALPGIGPWTAQYVSLRGLAEPDAFPTADLVVRKMASDGGPPLTARALEARAEAWRPWRGYAVLHLWRAAQDQRSRSPVVGRSTKR